MRVIHIISSLNLGGAEHMLKRLIDSSPNNTPDQIVISLTSLGIIGDSLRRNGVTVHTMHMSSVFDFFITLGRLVSLIKYYRPNVVQTWMYHADLIGGIAARLAGNCAIVWGVRSTSIPQGMMSVTYWVVRLCALLSHFIPKKIICCAAAAKVSHVKLNYATNKLIVIPNGYNFSDLRFDLQARLNIRAQLDILENEILIGVVGRFDPLKDFFNFISAAAISAKHNKNIKFLMVGRGNEFTNTTLCQWIQDAGLTGRVLLVGEQSVVNNYMSAMDIFCLSSSSEGFPNVLVEAMGMGLPCVVTCAGDSAIILDDADYIVPVKDATALADALLKMCDLESDARRALGIRNAKRVKRMYGIEVIRENYMDVYELLTK